MSSPEVDSILARLLDPARPLPPLCPKKVYDPDLQKQIGKLPEHKYLVAGAPLQAPLTCPTMLTRAVLHLANDDIEGCHLIAQANEAVRSVLAWWVG